MDRGIHDMAKKEISGAGGAKLPLKKCEEVLENYIFTDLIEQKIPGTKKEPSTKYETELFEELVSNWYTMWNRNAKVIKSFEFLCGCKDHRKYSKFLKVSANRKMHRGLSITAFSTPFAKKIFKKIKTGNLSKSMTVNGFKYIGYDEPYIPKYPIESWSSNSLMAFNYGGDGAAADPAKSGRELKAGLEAMSRALKKYEKTKSDSEYMNLEGEILYTGIPMMIVTKPNAYTVMKPTFSNHILRAGADTSSLGDEDEMVQLKKTAKPATWYVPEVCANAIKIVF